VRINDPFEKGDAYQEAKIKEIILILYFNFSMLGKMLKKHKTEPLYAHIKNM